MSEINNPDKEIGKPSVELTPEQLRAQKDATVRAGDGLGDGFAENGPEKKDDPGKKDVGGSPWSPEEKREKALVDTSQVENEEKAVRSDDSGVKLHNTEKTLSGRDLTQEEQEINNRFRGDQFDPKNSFNEKIPIEKREALVDANTSATCKLNENLDGQITSNDKYINQMSETQKENLQELKDIRKTVPEVTENTVMQKVIPEGEYRHYVGKDPPPYTSVKGCFSRAEDVAPYTNNITEAYENLRLDYNPGQDKPNPYIDAVNSKGDMYVMRITSDHRPSNDDIPKSEPPCTETGYVGSDKHLIPEYTYPKGSPITDGAIYRIDHDGNETLVAIWNHREQCFEEIK